MDFETSTRQRAKNKCRIIIPDFRMCKGWILRGLWSRVSIGLTILKQLKRSSQKNNRLQDSEVVSWSRFFKCRKFWASCQIIQNHLNPWAPRKCYGEKKCYANVTYLRDRRFARLLKKLEDGPTRCWDPEALLHR